MYFIYEQSLQFHRSVTPGLELYYTVAELDSALETYNQ